MKKIATTIALSALFMAGVIDNAAASIFTRNNKVTIDELQKAFGNDTVGGKSYQNSTRVLYDSLVAARKVFESTAKTYKLKKDANVKVFVELLDKTEEALIDIYQSEKGSKIIDKASKAKSYYDQNIGVYTLVKKKMGATLQPFETQFRDLAVPQFAGSTGNISLAAKDVFDIITNLKKQMENETAQTPQTTVIVVPESGTEISRSPSSASDGNWMFNNPNMVTPQTTQEVNKVVMQQAAHEQIKETPATTPVAAPLDQKTTTASPVMPQPVIVQPVAQQPTRIIKRGGGR